MIHIKTQKEILIMRDVCKRTSIILNHLILSTKVGMTGLDINILTKEYFKLFNVESAFLNLYSFPAQLCISVNENLIHGIPDSRPFEEGDKITYDIGAKLNGFYSDMARTFILGTTKNEKYAKLIRDTQEGLDAGIAVIKEGVAIVEIARAIENVAIKNSYGLIEDYGGHGIGEQVHQEPHISNSVAKARPVILIAGMTICLEPMYMLGSTKLVSDGKWNLKSEDGSIGCHLEDCILVKKDGYEVLQEVKANPETLHIPVVLLTNLDGVADVEKALELGATTYLVKADYKLEEVTKKIKEILNIK